MSLFTTVTTKRAKPGTAPGDYLYSVFYSLLYFNRCSDSCRFRLLFRLCNSLKLFHSFFTKGYKKQNQVNSLLWAYVLAAITKYNSSHTPSLSPSEVFLVADWLLMVDARLQNSPSHGLNKQEFFIPVIFNQSIYPCQQVVKQVLTFKEGDGVS